MASNPYVNKVQLADGTTLIDISDTTAVASDVVSGKYFYASNGQKKIGTGANVFVVTLSYDATEDKWLPDCTFSALASAYNAGKNIVFKATNASESDVQVSGMCIASEETGELVECGYYVVEYDFNNQCQYYRPYAFTATGIVGDSKDPYWWAGETTADDSKVLSGYTYVNGNGLSTGTYVPPPDGNNMSYGYTDATLPYVGIAKVGQAVI